MIDVNTCLFDEGGIQRLRARSVYWSKHSARFAFDRCSFSYCVSRIMFCLCFSECFSGPILQQDHCFFCVSVNFKCNNLWPIYKKQTPPPKWAWSRDALSYFGPVIYLEWSKMDTRVVASTQSFKYQYKYQYLSVKYQYQYPCLKYKYKYRYFGSKYQYQYKYLKMVHMFFSHSLTPPYLLFTKSNNT